MSNPFFSCADTGFENNATLGEIGIPDPAPFFPELFDLDKAESYAVGFDDCDWLFDGVPGQQQPGEQQQQGYAHPGLPVEMYLYQGVAGQEQTLDDSYWLPVASDYNPLYTFQDSEQWTNPLLDFQALDTTPGLTAFPGASEISQHQLVEYERYSYYPDPTTLTYHTHPYFTQPVPPEHTGSTPIDSKFQLTQDALYDFGSQQVPCDYIHPGLKSHRPSSTNDESLSSLPSSDSESSNANDQDNALSPVLFSSRRSRRPSTVSDSSALSQPVREQHEYMKGETPKKDDSKPWIRINGTTRGESTRTSKVNNWENTYKYRPLPVGDWQSERHRFEYRQDNGVDFLKKIPISTRQVQDYIKEYPEDGDKHLIMWIQKAPADSGRRAGSAQHFKCLFRDCPVQRWGDGTISTGEFRVAFDEKHEKYRSEVDPFDCVAYAHLYCMERFLNFPKVCQVADVRVDVRCSMPREPKGKATFSFSGHPAFPIVKRFVKLASRNTLRRSPNFACYPIHDDYERGERKPHEYTLVCQIYKAVLKHLPDSQREQFARRPISTGQREIHLGDLEIALAVKKIQSMVGRKMCESKEFQFKHYYDECDPNINIRIAQRMEECATIIREADKRGSARDRRQKKRKAIGSDESEDEELQQRSFATRSKCAGSRKRRQFDYQEPEDVLQLDFTRAHNGTQCDQAPRLVLQTIDPRLTTPPRWAKSPVTPRTGCSDLFPCDGTLDISNFPVTQDDIPEDNFEKLMAFNNSLERRASVSLGPHSGIMKSPDLRRTARPLRQASFNIQPVSSSTEYFVNDPPSQVAVSPRITLGQSELFERRSARVMARTASSGRLSSRCG